MQFLKFRGVAFTGERVSTFNRLSASLAAALGQQPSMDIFLVKPDASGLENVTNNSAMRDLNALWLPQQ